MSINHVTISYGPVRSFNLSPEHRPQFLTGITDQLRKLAYSVDLKPVKRLNLCQIEMCGYEVFRCNLQNLGFNMPCQRDPVDQLALEAVEKSQEKLSRARTFLWLRDLLNTQVFDRSDNLLKERWLSAKPSLGELAAPATCVDCCSILLDSSGGIPKKILEFDHKSRGDILFQDILNAFRHKSIVADKENYITNDVDAKEQLFAAREQTEDEIGNQAIDKAIGTATAIDMATSTTTDKPMALSIKQMEKDYEQMLTEFRCYMDMIPEDKTMNIAPYKLMSSFKRFAKM